MCANLNAEFKRVKTKKQGVLSGSQKISKVKKKKRIQTSQTTKQKEPKSEEEH